MKVLHLVPVAFPEGPGGIQVHVRGLVAAQARRGHEVCVLAGSLEGRDEVQLEEENVEGQRVIRLYRDDLHHIHYANGYHAGASRLVGEVLERERPDVAHVHSWIALSTDLVALAERYGCATVVTLHDYLVSCPRCYRQHADGNACERPFGVESCAPCVPRLGGESEEQVRGAIELFGASLRAELGRARCLVTLTPETSARLVRLGGLERDDIEALPLAYEPHRGTASLALDPEPGEPLRLATWGRLSWHKGTDELLVGFRAACERLPDDAVELHLFGELAPADFTQRVRELASGLPVTLHGDFGFEDLARVAPHAALFPSRCLETWGFVLDEARELGLPMAVTDLGAYGERGRVDALLVDPGDTDGWSAAIERLVREPGLRSQLVARSPGLPATPDGYAERLDAVYARALDAGPREPAPAVPDPARWERVRWRAPRPAASDGSE